MTTSVIEVIGSIREQGLKVADDSLRVITRPAVGEFVAQGDLNIWPLDVLPESAVPAEPNPQLAPGTSRGSRHCIRLEDMPKVKFYRLESGSVINGPVLEFTDDVTIEHPEHGDQRWGAGIVAITYQMMHSVELKRMAD